MCQFYHDKFDFLEFSQRNRGRIRYDNSSRDKVGRSDRRGRYEMPDVRGRGERIFWGGRDERSDMRGRDRREEMYGRREESGYRRDRGVGVRFSGNGERRY